MATIRGVIDSTLELRPNVFGDEHAARWIYELEQKISNEILGVLLPTDLPSDDGWEVPLLIKGTYERLYQLYLISQIDLTLQEYESYNNSIIAFNSLWKEFLNYVSRNGINSKSYYWKGVV